MKRYIIVSLFLLTMINTSISIAHGPATGPFGKIPTLSPLLKEINPAVVNISVFTTRSMKNPLFNDPMFRDFFNIPPGHSQKRRSQSAGSGVIVKADDGIVITNYHVVEAADEIKVGLKDGRSFEAKLIGSDPEVDIAVLKIKADDLHELVLADSDQLEVGDFVVAVGNPFSLGHTVTTGVVSALGRSGLGIEGYENFIQTDASINPGNSGGALVNLKGELVGINTAIIAPSGGNVGIGFAIPMNMAKNSLEQILEHGEVKRGRLGIMIQDLTSELAEAFHFKKSQRGVLVSEVEKGSAADDAGVKSGDIVTALNDKPLKSAAQLRNAVGMRRAGDSVKLTVLRDGKEKIITVNIGKSESSWFSLSKRFEKLDGADLQNNPDGDGVLVANIKPGSPAAYTGLQPRDIILSANHNKIDNLDDLQDTIKSAEERILLRIQRGRGALYIVINK